MTVVAWILFIVFGLIGFGLLRKFFSTRVNKAEVIFLVFSVFVAAISAGILFGGLKITP